MEQLFLMRSIVGQDTAEHAHCIYQLPMQSRMKQMTASCEHSTYQSLMLEAEMGSETMDTNSSFLMADCLSATKVSNYTGYYS
jgi:hypothetical protein